nr:hypothetical protein BV013_00707 [Haemophilus influenzae]PRI84159.1 hypothetical protein BV014_00944 [Haemophilus influenzae]
MLKPTLEPLATLKVVSLLNDIPFKFERYERVPALVFPLESMVTSKLLPGATFKVVTFQWERPPTLLNHETEGDTMLIFTFPEIFKVPSNLFEILPSVLLLELNINPLPVPFIETLLNLKPLELPEVITP